MRALLKRWFGGRRVPVRRSVRPGLEALEGREVPARLSWVGNADDPRWTVAGNWRDLDTGANSDHAPTVGDTVTLGDLSRSDCVVPTAEMAVVDRLDTEGLFIGYDLVLEGRLEVRAASGNGGMWLAGDLDQVNSWNSRLEITKGLYTWAAGTWNFLNEYGRSDVVVHSGARLVVDANSDVLGSTIHAGWNGTAGTVNLSDWSNRDLTLTRGADVVVHKAGEVLLNRGLRVNPGSLSTLEIESGGVLRRNAGAQNGYEKITIDTPVINNGLVEFATTYDLQITGSVAGAGYSYYNGSTGWTLLGSGCELILPGSTEAVFHQVAGGVLETGSGTASIQGHAKFYGGEVYVSGKGQTSLGTLRIGANLYVEGARFHFDIDGRDPAGFDRVSVGGGCSLKPGTIFQVNTIGADAPAGRTYDLVTSSAGMAGTQDVQLVHTGLGDGYEWVMNGPQYFYRIKAR